MPILLKRVYDPPESIDGTRILVDRLWPRGINKEAAKIDLWLKSLAPGKELRKCFHHDPEHWQEFRRRYLTELTGPRHDTEALNRIISLMRQGVVTLIYAAKDTEHNNALVLKEFLENHQHVEGRRL